MSGPAMSKAAFASAGAVFAFGFLFGMLRIFVLIPRMGPLAAVSVELPFMLVISALVWRWSLARYLVPSDMAKRLITGLSGFVILMGLEFLLSWLIAETGPVRFIREIANPAGLLGLAGQFAFALMPLAIPARREGR